MNMVGNFLCLCSHDNLAAAILWDSTQFLSFIVGSRFLLMKKGTKVMGLVCNQYLPIHSIPVFRFLFIVFEHAWIQVSVW